MKNVCNLNINNTNEIHSNTFFTEHNYDDNEHNSLLQNDNSNSRNRTSLNASSNNVKTNLKELYLSDKILKKELKNPNINNLIVINNPDDTLSIGESNSSLTVEINCNTQSKCLKNFDVNLIINSYFYINKNKSNINQNLISYNQSEINYNNYISESKQKQLIVEKFCIKCTVFVVFFVILIIELLYLKKSILDENITLNNLRHIHILMTDNQLYHMLLSFLIVSLFINILQLLILFFALYNNKIYNVQFFLKISTMSLIFVFTEIIIAKYDYSLIFLKICLVCLVKKWLSNTIDLNKNVVSNLQII